MSGDLFMKRDAEISDCGLYRYRLIRRWDRDRPMVLVIMLNPSTANAFLDDPTIHSLIRLCRALGFGGFVVVNMFAWRATDPKELRSARDPIGPHNDAVIRNELQCWTPVICAWGAHPMATSRIPAVWNLMLDAGRQPMCFETTKAGHPKHPLARGRARIVPGTALSEFQWVSAP